VVNGVLGLVGLVPSAGTDPGGPPVDSPALLVFLAYARRQIQEQLFNSAPTTAYDPTENSEAADGTVTGNLNSNDADGDPLTYNVTQDPGHGSVVVHDDGTFTYTPDDDYAESGGPDDFSVVVSDAGQHAHGLFGFLAPDGGHTTTAPVSLTVTPVETNRAPTADPTKFTQVAGDASTGTVTGSLGVTDPNGDPLTYTIVDGPKGGSLVIDPETGTYTYTPDTAARLKAGLATPENAPAARTFAAAEVAADATPDATHDGFTYTVSDGAHDPVTVTVSNINVAPLYVTVGQPISYASPSLPGGVIAGHDGTGYFVDQDQRTIYAVSPDGSVRPLVSNITSGGLPSSYALSPDGTKLYMPIFSSDGHTLGNTVNVVDTSTGDVTKTITVPDGPSTVAVAQNGRVFVGSLSYEISPTNQVTYHTTITEIDANDDTVVSSHEIPTGDYILQMNTDSTGSRLYYYAVNPSTGAPKYVVMDTATGESRQIDVSNGLLIPSASISKDGKQLYFPNFTKNDSGSISGLQVVVVDNDPASDTYLQQVEVIDKDDLGGYTPSPVAIGYSPDGSAMYVPGGVLNDDLTTDQLGIIIIDAHDHSLIGFVPLDSTTASGVAFSDDGEHGYVTDAGPNFSGPGTVSVITFSPTKPATVV
jgi:hypothetical protein